MGLFTQFRAFAACSAGLMLVAGAGCNMFGRPATPGLGWLGWGRGAGPSAADTAALQPPSVTQSPDYPKTESPAAPTAPAGGYPVGPYGMTADNGANSANKPESAPPGVPGGAAAGPNAWAGANPAGVNQGFYNPEYPGDAGASPSAPAAPGFAAAPPAQPDPNAYGAAPGYGPAPGYDAAPAYGGPPGFDAAPPAQPPVDPNAYAQAAPGYDPAAGNAAAPGYDPAAGYGPAPGNDAPPGFAAAPPAQGDPNAPPSYDPNAGYAGGPTAPYPEAAPPAGNYPDPRMNAGNPAQPPEYAVPDAYGQPATPRGRIDVAGNPRAYDRAGTIPPNSNATYGANPATNASSTPHRADPNYRPGGVRDFFPATGANGSTTYDANRGAVQPANYDRPY